MATARRAQAPAGPAAPAALRDLTFAAGGCGAQDAVQEAHHRYVVLSPHGWAASGAHGGSGPTVAASGTETVAQKRGILNRRV